MKENEGLPEGIEGIEGIEDFDEYIDKEIEKELDEVIEKQKMQFSKKICIFSCVFVVMCWIGNFTLLLLGREQMSDVISVGFTKCRRKAPTFMYGDIRR